MASEKSEELLTAMITTTLAVIKLVDDSRVPKSIADQVIRSTGSIGANFSEAQEASSKRDFVNKIFIAKKEAQETKYWLRIVKELLPVNEIIEQEVQRYLMTLQKIITSTKEKN